MKHSAGPRIGIDLGGTKIEGIVLSPDGRERTRLRVPTPHGDYQGTLAAVRELVAALEAETGEPASVGVGMPGALSRRTGLVKNANSTWLIGRPLDRDLAEALGRPVRLANDADCFALSESVDGAAAGAASAFGVILGTGVGGGIALGGRPMAGPNGIAGEWGHNPLPWADPAADPAHPCYCGKRGCIETYLSGPGLSAHHAEAAGEVLTAREIVSAAAEGAPAARESLTRYADRLARALAHVLNILDPEIVVLGGGLSNVAALYESVPVLWQQYVFSDSVDTDLRPPVHGDSGGVRGAAWLWPEAERHAGLPAP